MNPPTVNPHSDRPGADRTHPADLRRRDISALTGMILEREFRGQSQPTRGEIVRDFPHLLPSDISATFCAVRAAKSYILS